MALVLLGICHEATIPCSIIVTMLFVVAKYNLNLTPKGPRAF
jgi:hypothetical protein